MQKFSWTIAAAAAALFMGSVTNSAHAITLGGSDGIRASVDEASVIDSVHCVPGVWHHRFRPHDGCLRYLSVYPRVYTGYRFGGYRYGGYRRFGGFRFGGRYRR